MGEEAVRVYGLDGCPQTLEESIGGMMKVFDAATKESHGGRFWNYDGKENVW